MSLPTNHVMVEQHGMMYHIHGSVVGILKSTILAYTPHTHFSFTMSLLQNTHHHLYMCMGSSTPSP